MVAIVCLIFVGAVFFAQKATYIEAKEVRTIHYKRNYAHKLSGI